VFDFALLIPLFAIFFIFGVPIMAAATHFVLRPMVRDVIGAIQGRKEEEDAGLMRRIDRIEEAVLDQGQQIDRLVEAEVFRRQLETGGRDRQLPNLEEQK
jgi:hypothetical protein